VLLRALEVIRNGRPDVYQVDLTDDYRHEDAEKVCGGMMVVLIEPFGPIGGRG